MNRRPNRTRSEHYFLGQRGVESPAKTERNTTSMMMIQYSSTPTYHTRCAQWKLSHTTISPNAIRNEPAPIVSERDKASFGRLWEFFG
jgi:hypothetical protein